MTDRQSSLRSPLVATLPRRRARATPTTTAQASRRLGGYALRLLPLRGCSLRSPLLSAALCFGGQTKRGFGIIASAKRKLPRRKENGFARRGLPPQLQASGTKAPFCMVAFALECRLPTLRLARLSVKVCRNSRLRWQGNAEFIPPPRNQLRPPQGGLRKARPLARSDR